MFLRILSITLLLSMGVVSSRRGRHASSPESPCCVRAPFTRVNVTGATYQNQTAHGSCVAAIIVQTDQGKKACVSPRAKWLQQVIGNMTLESQ